MLQWSPDDRAMREPPSDVRDAIMAVRGALQRLARDGYPRLERVESRADESEWADFVATVEVAPGLLLPTEHVQEAWGGPLADARERLIADLMEGHAVALAHVGPLSAKVDEVRAEARRLVGDLQHEGLPVSLLRVSLSPYDGWRGSVDPQFDLEVELLDNRLRPAVHEMRVERVEQLQDEFDMLADTQRRRARTRADISRQGADGLIDALALVAIDAQADRTRLLRLLAASERLWLQDGTCLAWEDGRVVAANNSRVIGFSWDGDRFTAHGMSLGDEEARAAVGSPATQLMPHPYLTSEMIVRKVVRSRDEDVPTVTMSLDMPRWRFCASAARHW